MDKCDLRLLNRVAQTIFDKKGFNILALDMHPCCSLVDYVLIAEGMADRHVIAIAKAILEVMDQEKISPIFVEGLEEGDWIVLDFSWLVIHLFMPGIRDRYHLEGLWRKADIVDLTIEVPAHLSA
jgi:ribosome-associated protein